MSDRSWRSGFFAATSGAMICAACALVAPDKDWAPSVSPDGSQVAFYSYRGGNPDLYVIDLATGLERQVTATADTWEIEPQWTPDGAHLYFGGGANMQSLRVRLIETSTGEVNDFSSADVGRGPASVNASGDAMFIFSDDEDGALLKVSRNGDVDRIDAPWPEGANGSPNASPRGEYVAFRNERNDVVDVYILDVVSGDIWRATDTGVEKHFIDWTHPDWITFSQPVGDGRRVFGARVDVESRSAEAPAMLSRGESEHVHMFSAMSPDGAWLYFDSNAGRRNRIFRLSLTDTAARPEQISGTR